MVTLFQSNQIVRPQKPFRRWVDRLNSAITQKRLTFVIALTSAIILAVVPFSGAVTDQTVKASAKSTDDVDTWPLAQAPRPIDDQAIYLHSKLMRIGVTKSGAPVLRFVDCRHYPKEHMKVVQTKIGSGGQPVLRLMPGDYCLLESALALSASEVQVVGDSESLQPNQAPFSRSETPRQPGPLQDLLTPYQRYACEKFGPACPIALAIQSAENPGGACEIYHYNSVNGTLDWGFFQINTVHLMRPGVNLRDLLDCKANIDYAYQLYSERGFVPWSTFVSGAYRKFLGHYQVRLSASMSLTRGQLPFNVLPSR
jgi:hypothetical protein